MLTLKQVSIPVLVRVNNGALARVGLYARRQQFTRVIA